jgi:antitoxin component YwqK of YwqJK toxin-antitoxin module
MTNIGFFYNDFYLMKIEVMDEMYTDAVVSYKFPEYGRYYTRAYKVLSIIDIKSKSEKNGVKKYKTANCYREKDTIYYYKSEEAAFSANLSNFIKKNYLTINGEQKEYHENGQLYLHKFYKNNLLDGEYYHYTINGTLFSKQNYVNGKLNGLSTFYNWSGEKIRDELYVDNKMIEITKY